MKKQLILTSILISLFIFSCGPAVQKDTNSSVSERRVPPPPSWNGKLCRLKEGGPLAYLIPILGEIYFTCTADNGATIRINNGTQDYDKNGFELKP